MTSAAKIKGDNAERECEKILTEVLGVPVRRKLGAGRQDDMGDMDVPNTTIQVADYTDVLRALNNKLPACVIQQERAGSRYGACMIRRRGGKYFMALSVEQFAQLWRDANAV